MKIYLPFLIFILFPILLGAQDISVKSFNKRQNDLDARIHKPIKDQNGEKCAIIKVVTSQKGFKWEGDALGIIKAVYKTGEYWLYVPHGSKRLTIKHEKLGILRDYRYPSSIKEATVYELVLTTGKVVTSVVDYELKTQWLVITSEPDRASVYINEEYKGETPFQQEIILGKNSYRLEYPMYHKLKGTLELVGGEAIFIDTTLKPNFGSIRVNSIPEDGASVFLDGEDTKLLTPCTLLKISSGEHIVSLKHTWYQPLSLKAIVLDEDSNVLDIEMKPNFGSIRVNSIPEDGASVFLDGKDTKLLTPCTLLKISSGEHIVSLKHPWYQPLSLKAIVLDEGSNVLDIEMKPNFDIVTVKTDKTSTVVIDSIVRGNGDWSGKLLTGIHLFEVKKKNHKTVRIKRNIVIGERKEISISPTGIYGALKIQTTPFGAKIILNDTEYGKTPKTITKLLIGEYSLRLIKEGFRDEIIDLTIEDSKINQVNKALYNGKEYNIISEPKYSSVYIDGDYKGTTPIKLFFSIDKYNIKLSKGKFMFHKDIYIDNQVGTELFFQLSEQCLTLGNCILYVGSREVKISKGENVNIISKEGMYFNVEYKNLTGLINKYYLESYRGTN